MFKIIPKNNYPYLESYSYYKTGNDISTGYTPKSLLTLLAYLVTFP